MVENIFKFNSKLAGVSFDNRQDLIKTLVPGDTLILKAEPDNEWDSNAVAVYNISNEQLGYIKKDTAAKINADVRVGHVKCTVSEVTGGVDGKENYGVNILIEVKREDEGQ